MKTFITNRDGDRICVVIENETHANNKLVFVMHGLGGNKEQPHIRAMANVFIEHGYTVVTFDAVHTFGESEGGLYEDATITNYYADLEDVIAWASTQIWYVEPFVLCGHSLGGISTTLFAERYPEKVKALAPISTVVSGELSMQTKANDFETWKATGIRTTKSHDGSRVKTLKWLHMEDRMQYDLLKEAGRLTMPVLLAVGDMDEPTPFNHQEIFFDKLPGKKELHVINGALHSFYEEHERTELGTILGNWLRENNLT